MPLYLGCPIRPPPLFTTAFAPDAKRRYVRRLSILVPNMKQRYTVTFHDSRRIWPRQKALCAALSHPAGRRLQGRRRMRSQCCKKQLWRAPSWRLGRGATAVRTQTSFPGRVSACAALFLKTMNFREFCACGHFLQLRARRSNGAGKSLRRCSLAGASICAKAFSQLIEKPLQKPPLTCQDAAPWGRRQCP